MPPLGNNVFLEPGQNRAKMVFFQKTLVNPNHQGGEGVYKVPEAFLNAQHYIYDEIWVINPSCKFVFFLC